MRVLILSVFLVLMSGCVDLGSLMIVEKPSPLNFQDTIQKLEQNIASKNWEISKKFDFQKSILDKKQVDVGPVVSLKICQPDHALSILKSDENKYVSAMMPCSISVYQKGAKTYIAYMNIGLMKSFFSKEISHIMELVQNDINEIVKL